MSDKESTITQNSSEEKERRKERRKSKRRKKSSTSDDIQAADEYPKEHRIRRDLLKQHIDSDDNSANTKTSDDVTGTVKQRLNKNRKSYNGYDAVAECRKMFKREMVLLGKEVEQFRRSCQAEINKYKRLVQDHKAKYESIKEGQKDEDNEHGKLSRTTSGSSMGDKAWEEMLSNLQLDMDFLSRKQTILDREQELMDKEESLSSRQKELEEYEKEILEVERMLDRRQDMCASRQKNLLSLDEELQHLRKELEISRNKLEVQGVNTESATDRARHNWDIVRKNLIEKQTFLESTVQKYRTDLASAQTNITSKDLLLNKLQSEISELRNELQNKTTKIKQLESRLTLTIDEARVLEKRFQHHKFISSDSGSPMKYNHINMDYGDSENASTNSTPKHTSHGTLRKQPSSLALLMNKNNFNRTSSKLDNDNENSTPDAGGDENSQSQKIIRHEHLWHQSMELSNGESKYRSKDFKPANDDKSSSCVVM